MTSITRLLSVALLYLLSTSQLTAQCMQYEVPLDDIIHGSTVIVEGQVKSQKSFQHSTRKNIYTVHTIDITKVLKGDTERTTIDVLTRGGRVANLQEMVRPEVQLSTGERGLFLLQAIQKVPDLYHLATETKLASTYAMWTMEQSYFKYNKTIRKATSAFRSYDLQGKTAIDRIATTTGLSPTVVQSFDLEGWLQEVEEADSRMITNLNPSTITAGTNSILTVSGSGFGNSAGTINMFNANTLSLTTVNNDNITNWSNNSISYLVPRWGATGPVQIVTQGGTQYTSASDLTVTYAINSYDDPNLQQNDIIRYVSDNSSGEVTYQLNNSLAANGPAAAAVQRAIGSWRCSTGTNIIIGPNTSINSNAPDGTNVITFAPLPTGTLGIANQYFQWCSATPVLRESFDTDVRLNSSTNWQYGPANPSGSQADFESVVLHELGHNIGLGHINNLGAVMHPFIFNSTTSREVDTPAEAAALYILPFHQSPTTCSDNFPMTPLSPILVTSSSPTGSGSLQQAITDACPGQTIDFSSSLIGSTILTNGTPIIIDKSITLIGLGMNSLTLSGNNTSRIFDVSPTIDFTLQDITLTNGQSSSNGGAFYNQGTITLQNVTLEGNMEGSTPRAWSSDPDRTVIIREDVIINE